MVKKLSALEKLAGRAAPVAVDDDSKPVEIPLDKLRFDATQPRQAFHHPDGRVAEEDEKAVQELVESITSNGLIHPITVEAVGDGTYRVVVGERRTRAHIQLGKATILARVRNDLKKRKTRLVYQLAENVNREDLTDAEMASSIRVLMQSHDGEPGMLQSEIAAHLGKSEGWVSRYVKYGDVELQRLWVETGIADSVEKVYRISVLPMPVQVEIQRRVQLPEDHPEYLAKPLNRGVIDELARAAKAARVGASQAPATPAPTAPASSHFKEASGSVEPDAGVNDADSVSQQLAQMAREGRESQSPGVKSPAPATAPATTKTPLAGGTAHAATGYQLPVGDRAKILGAASVVLQSGQGGTAQPPINVRIPVVSLQRLLERLAPVDRDALALVQLSVSLPGPLAARIANELAGVVVDEREVPAVVQNELTKLQ